MLLKNYYKALAMLMGDEDLQIEGPGGSTSSSMLGKNYADELVSIKDMITSIGNMSHISGVVFGSGTTAPVINDNQLESRISTISGTVNYSVNKDDNFYAIIISATITNTASDDITIAEVGLYRNTTGNWGALVERTVLEAPVTIPAGGVGQITYTIRMNYPTA